MKTDRHGLPLSTASDAARDAYVQGVDALLVARPRPAEPLVRAVEADAGFALAWIALARARFVEADVAGARTAAARARALTGGLGAREAGHVHALALAIDGRPAEALAATREHLARFPRDALVLAPATGVFGLIGFSGRSGREAELHHELQSLAPHYGDDGWFQSALAFAECETGRLDAALPRIERSLAACPDNAHGRHVLAHVRYERGEPARAAHELGHWLPGYDRVGLMHCHLSWHAALSALALGDADRAWSIYRTAVHPGAAWGPPLNLVTDAVSFLWRAECAGQPHDARLWADVHAVALRLFPTVGLAFADVHVALACAAVGDDARCAQMAEELALRVAEARLPAGEVVPTLVCAYAAWARRDVPAALAGLAAAQADLVRIGGSRAQRDLVGDSITAARRRAGVATGRLSGERRGPRAA